MPEPLLPEHYPTEPFFDASAAVGDPARLRTIADELGYLYLRHWIRIPRLEAVRAFVRSFALAQHWIEPVKNNPPVFLARRGPVSRDAAGTIPPGSSCSGASPAPPSSRR